MLSSTLVVNGSVRMGEVHSASTGSSGTRASARSWTRAEARAMATAREAACSTASRVRVSVEAKPQAPPATTRTPMPMVSLTDAWPTFPFLVET